LFYIVLVKGRDGIKVEEHVVDFISIYNNHFKN